MQPKWHLTREEIVEVIKGMQQDNPFAVYLALQREQKIKQMEAELTKESLAFDFLVESSKTDGTFN